MKNRIYIAGPMTGYENYNFYAFDAAKRMLLAAGWNPISPADIDRAHGFDATLIGQEVDLSPMGIGLIFARDIMALSQCDAIYMMDGWELSSGANIEGLFAEIIKLKKYYQADGDMPLFNNLGVDKDQLALPIQEDRAPEFGQQSC